MDRSADWHGRTGNLDPASNAVARHRTYLPNNSSKAGLLDETRLFLLTYTRLGDVNAARRELVNSALAQRSRATRVSIARVINERLLRWQPPDWVLDDLAVFAHDDSGLNLPLALLLHAARQDVLLYDVIQRLIVSRWRGGERAVSRADVQRFLDEAEPDHPEIGRWTRQTREKLAGNLLTIGRDYGLLRGALRKQIVEPVIPEPVRRHLARLLLAEGITPADLSDHPDWHLWLWDNERARTELALIARVEVPA